MNITDLIEMFHKAVRDAGAADDLALYHLLEGHKDRLPKLDGYFHKAFRQGDVTGSGNIDMALWYLIGNSKLFWYCFDLLKARQGGGR